MATIISNTYTPSIGYPYVVKNDNGRMGINANKKIWLRIREALRDNRRRGIQQEAADICGIKQPSVAEWVSGESIPTMDNVLKLSEELNVCVEWLYTGRGPKHPGPPEDPHAHQLWEFWPRLTADARSRIVGSAEALASPLSSTTPRRKAS
jgi:transcriptional regulator with XRE-family HTH domain